MGALRAYQTPNLVEVFQATIQITSDTEYLASTDYRPKNLINNLQNRRSGNSLKAIASQLANSPYTTTELDDESCYIVDYDNLSSRNYKLVLGLDFSESVFIHAVVHLQDFLDGQSYD